jgi:hypothetical protein
MTPLVLLLIIIAAALALHAHSLWWCLRSGREAA